MSETKHTPLPWAYDGRSWTVDAKYGRVPFLAYGYTKEEAGANSKLIRTSVNACPKVEELIEEIIRIHKEWGHLGWKAPPAMRNILAKAREVEAALGGEAE